MTFEERIDEIFEKIQSTPLSCVLPLIMPLALQCKDYIGYCVLNFWGRPYSSQNAGSVFYANEMEKTLIGEGLDKVTIDKISESALSEYINLRTVGENKVMCFSVKELENKIKYLNDVLATIESPQGKVTILDKREQLEHQCAILLTYISTKLNIYRRLLHSQERKFSMERATKNTKNIFIIHGHNEAKRRELEVLLKDRFGLNPIILLNEADQGLTIIEKFEEYAKDCSYAFALFTPDDIVIDGDKQYFQARPNVIFELGWFCAKLGRSRVCILDQESEQSQIFSDLQGVLRIQFKENVSEKYIEIERELSSAGII